MREFTVKDIIHDFEFLHIEKFFGRELPKSLKMILKKYGGFAIEEDTFIDPINNLEWTLQEFNRFPEIYDLAIEFKKAGWGEKVAFAFDPGGWHFCIDMSLLNYQKIYINRWTDHAPEDQFLLIANNFEELMDGLHRKDDEV